MASTTTTTGLLCIVLAGFGAGALLGACKYELRNAEHCSNREGDQYCAMRFPDEPLCSSGHDASCSAGYPYGCVAASEMQAGCHDPCGTLSDEECPGMGTGTGTTSTTTLEPSSSSDSGSSSSSGTTPCSTNEDCPEPSAPFCNDDAICVPCDQAPLPDQADDACVTAEPSLPVCQDGTCVQCTPSNPAACTESTPVCDEATNTCSPCTAHSQCGEAACNFFTGACLPPDRVRHVGPGQEYTSISAAVASFTAQADQGTIIIHQASYNEAVTVASQRTLAFLAADFGKGVTPPEWDTPAGNPSTPQLTVNNGSTAILDGLQLSGNGSSMAPGIRVDQAQLWLDRSRIVQNSGGGIRAQNNALLVARNCFVGDGTNGDHALLVDGATANLLSTTLGAGVDNFADVFPVYCTGSVDVTIRNSLLVSFDNPSEISCSTATVTSTASETLIAGTANVALGNVDMNWFVGVDIGDFHLDNPPAALDTAAQWLLGDPLTDIDGDLRPTADASPDFAGADVP